MKTDGVQDYINAQGKRLSLPGLSCSIAYRNNISTYTFGKSNLEHDVPVTESTVFNIASVGKLLTVISIFKLIEDGKFNLETTVSELLADVPACWKNIQIAHLLSHSSGIQNYTDTSDYWKECRLDVSRDQVIGYVKDADLEFDPGSRWKYSNSGFYLLGQIIERISDMGYFEFTGKIISGYKTGLVILPTDPYAIIHNRADGYILKNMEPVNVPYYSNSGTYSAGGISANLRDFIEFENAVFNGNILKEHSLDKIINPFLKEDGSSLRSPDPAFDFEMTHGLFRFNGSGEAHLRHRGEIFGFSTEYMRVPDSNFSMILSANRDSVAEISDMMDEIRALVAIG